MKLTTEDFDRLCDQAQGMTYLAQSKGLTHEVAAEVLVFTGLSLIYVQSGAQAMFDLAQKWADVELLISLKDQMTTLQQAVERQGQ